MSWWNREAMNLRDWAIDYLYRCDAGLYEIEKEYKEIGLTAKSANKMLNADRTYNQLQGKFHAVLCLLADFKIGFVPTNNRIAKRIKHHGAKIEMIKRNG